LNKDFIDKVILDSLGLLNENERQELKKELLNSPDEDQKLVSQMNNLVSLFPKAINTMLHDVTPSENVKDKLFARINSTENSFTQPVKKKFDFVFADSDDWVPHPEVDGIQIKQLSYNKEKNYAMLLFKVAADTIYPSHHHSGAEECYVIEGDLYAQGKLLGPGDFHHAEGGTDHDPLYSKNGCMAVLVIDTSEFE